MSVTSGIAELAASRELLGNLTLRELRGKYKRTVLGWGWSMLNPLAMMLTYSLVFGVLLHVKATTGAGGLRSYPLFLLCGLLPWTFVSNSVVMGMEALVVNAALVTKTYFRREVLVMSTVLSFAVTFLIEMAVLTVAFLAFGSMVLPWLVPALVLIALLVIFSTGVALALSVLNVYYRDARYLVGILMQLWFYATPILYPLHLVTDSKLPGWVVHIYRANPMVDFVQCMRSVLYERRFPPAVSLGYLVVVSLLAYGLGSLIFSRLSGRLAEEL
jgi:ABC-type polysaccharide/polyol phosphate export permease